MKRRTFIKKTSGFVSLLTIPVLSKAFSEDLLVTNDLPNVLILGDSISIGYTPFVKTLLKNKANVYRPVFENGKDENCEGTTKGIQNIERWLGTTKWEVIHFNFGLHDIKHVHPETRVNSNNPDHPQQADLKQYEKNMKIIIDKLKASGAKLIFATTTPYPDKTTNPLRKPGMAKKYNDAAINIMNSNKISIDDLYSFMKPRMEKLQIPNNVHFTSEGSKALAEKVVESINEKLEQ